MCTLLVAVIGSHDNPLDRLHHRIAYVAFAFSLPSGLILLLRSCHGGNCTLFSSIAVLAAGHTCPCRPDTPHYCTWHSQNVLIVIFALRRSRYVSCIHRAWSPLTCPLFSSDMAGVSKPSHLTLKSLAMLQKSSSAQRALSRLARYVRISHTADLALTAPISQISRPPRELPSGPLVQHFSTPIRGRNSAAAALPVSREKVCMHSPAASIIANAPPSRSGTSRAPSQHTDTSFPTGRACGTTSAALGAEAAPILDAQPVLPYNILRYSSLCERHVLSRWLHVARTSPSQ